MVTWPMTSHDIWSRDRWRHVTLKGQTRDPNMLRAQYLENSWRFYLATIANYYLVCCEAVRSAILATAWLLVIYPTLVRLQIWESYPSNFRTLLVSQVGEWLPYWSRDITFRLSQCTWWQSTNVTDGRTDRQMTYDRLIAILRIALRSNRSRGHTLTTTTRPWFNDS